MFEQREKRSEVREEALQYLIEAVLDRSDVRCAALVDGASARIVAGAGTPADLKALARVARAVARGDWRAATAQKSLPAGIRASWTQRTTSSPARSPSRRARSSSPPSAIASAA